MEEFAWVLTDHAVIMIIARLRIYIAAHQPKIPDQQEKTDSFIEMLIIRIHRNSEPVLQIFTLSLHPNALYLRHFNTFFGIFLFKS